MPTRLAKMVSFSMRVRPRLAAQSIGDLRRFLDSDSISRFTRSVKQPIRDSTAAAGAIYFPRTQWPENLMCLVARTAPSAGDLGPAIRQVIRGIDPSVPAMKLTTVDQIISASTADRRFYTTAMIAFAAVAYC